MAPNELFLLTAQKSQYSESVVLQQRFDYCKGVKWNDGRDFFKSASWRAWRLGFLKDNLAGRGLRNGCYWLVGDEIVGVSELSSHAESVSGWGHRTSWVSLLIWVTGLSSLSLFTRMENSEKYHGWVVVAHACNPSTLGGQRGQNTWGQEFKSSLTNIVKPCLY